MGNRRATVLGRIPPHRQYDRRRGITPPNMDFPTVYVVTSSKDRAPISTITRHIAQHCVVCRRKSCQRK
ncbi:hypothetical protein J6590_056980 [Homalodisca vitripennis]|nr:hypothetical protein J6590_056980 [Homalodisca vitripennis]